MSKRVSWEIGVRPYPAGKGSSVHDETVYFDGWARMDDTLDEFTMPKGSGSSTVTVTIYDPEGNSSQAPADWSNTVIDDLAAKLKEANERVFSEEA